MKYIFDYDGIVGVREEVWLSIEGELGGDKMHKLEFRI